MSKEQKAARLLAKMYSIRRLDFWNVKVSDIAEKATDEEINFYYYWFFFANNRRWYHV